jgi:hypothetical protein
VQVVRLVDEQHPAVGALEDLPGLRRGVPDVLADEVVARDGDEVASLEVPESLQDLRHPQRDGRLARARLPGEAHVERRPVGGEADLAPHPVDDEQRGDLPDPALHRLQADELRVEGLQGRVHRGELRRRGVQGGDGHRASA